MNNPYDPRTGMTRGYSTPFFMNALRYQTQVPASIGQRKVNHFFGNYSAYLKPVEELNPLRTKEDFLWDINKEQLFKPTTYFNPNTYYNMPDIEPSLDTTYNTPQSIWGGAGWGVLMRGDEENQKKAIDQHDAIKEIQALNDARKNTTPSRLNYIPDAESMEARTYMKWLSQNQREF